MTTPLLFLLRLALWPLSMLSGVVLTLLSPIIYMIHYALAPFYFLTTALPTLEVS
jgi:hypothetical protein